MTSNIYHLVESSYPTENGRRISYGITVCTDADSVPFSICDITSDKEKLLELIHKCNLLGLSPMHLCDVVEDFLAV